VIPANGSVFIAADVQGFSSRLASPRGGEGLFVLPLEQGAALPRAPAPLTISNARGETISSASV
jgi:hypothetical protein